MPPVNVLTKIISVDSQPASKRQRRYELTNTAYLPLWEFLQDPATLSMVRARASQAKQTCYICYAWGDPDLEAIVSRFADLMKRVCVEVHFDRDKNMTTGSITRFTRKLVESDVVAVFGTKLLKQKVEDTQHAHVLKEELPLVAARLRGSDRQAHSVIPILLEAPHSESFPHYFEDSVKSDFSPGTPDYFDTLIRIMDRLITVDEPGSARQVLNPPRFHIDYDITIPDQWVSRQADETRLSAFVLDAQVKMIEIVHLGGSGKSRFVRNWLNVQKTTLQSQFDQIAWFSFYYFRSNELLLPPFQALLNTLVRNFGLQREGTESEKTRIVERFLAENKVLLILDGVEIAQKKNGELKSPEFKAFLSAASQFTNGTKLVITSRVPLTEFRAGGTRRRGIVGLTLTPWTNADVGEFLTGDRENVSRLAHVVNTLGRHPLTLTVFKYYLELCNQDLRQTEAIIRTIKDQIHETESEQDQQSKKVVLLIREIASNLTERQSRMMKLVSLLYGDLSETHLTALGDTEGALVVRRVIDGFVQKDLVTEGRRHQIRTFTAHPMVKLGFYELMSTEDRMAGHRKLMAYFQVHVKRDQLETLDDFNEWMEWAHQVTKLVTLSDQLAAYRSQGEAMAQVQGTAAYQRCRSIMRYVMDERRAQLPTLMAEAFRGASDPQHGGYRSVQDYSLAVEDAMEIDTLQGHLSWDQTAVDRLARQLGQSRFHIHLASQCIRQNDLDVDQFFSDVGEEFVSSGTRQARFRKQTLGLVLTQIAQKNPMAYRLFTILLVLHQDFLTRDILTLFMTPQDLDQCIPFLGTYDLVSQEEMRVVFDPQVYQEFKLVLFERLRRDNTAFRSDIQSILTTIRDAYATDISILENWQRNQILFVHENAVVTIPEFEMSPNMDVVFYTLYLNTVTRVLPQRSERETTVKGLMGPNFFGPDEYQTLLDLEAEHCPELPTFITEEYLNGPCPVTPNKTIKDTHFLYWEGGMSLDQLADMVKRQGTHQIELAVNNEVVDLGLEGHFIHVQKNRGSYVTTSVGYGWKLVRIRPGTRELSNYRDASVQEAALPLLLFFIKNGRHFGGSETTTMMDREFSDWRQEKRITCTETFSMTRYSFSSDHKGGKRYHDDDPRRPRMKILLRPNRLVISNHLAPVNDSHYFLAYRS